ncbi:MBL fold metallo-hydrolase [Adhaeribacter radiodurans]|uniref:MBL fold metallo-hydrolase n=1 Tax=Adhaeribacter radiodurans TaxID=2745197 RepID=A0A7L7L9N9_9BACT|nr:MBL fold metallo-hydrolase [Adhaeribacter radiodurans]QMU29566.1 MBL fold metallo-hydrolase [Adhaeribacter radiodurans]
MSLFITSLNSGSNGNCYYVGNDQDAILVDAGISCRETEKRMCRLGLSMSKVKAIFISHEHSDHIRGLSVLARKYHLPVFITPATLLNSRLGTEQFYTIPLKGYDSISIGELSITAFPKSHDASDPHSFLITFQDIKVGVFTDIGFACEHVIHHFKQCHAAFLEANYDDELLDNGYYPYYLKNRIRSPKGHLSNKQALDLFAGYKPPFMSHVLLSHLSKNNNCPKLVKELFDRNADGTEVVVASRYEETPVYTIMSSKHVQASA